jgi:hypothetical protein
MNKGEEDDEMRRYNLKAKLKTEKKNEYYIPLR